MRPTRELKLKAEGIACTGCATDMETVLGNTDGISEATVDYAAGTVNIIFNPEEIAAELIIAIINKMGLKTTPLNSP